MRELIKQFAKIVVDSLTFVEPICEFGSLQVPTQEGFADLRPIFPGKEYVGCDMREGPGVDRILDLHNISLSSETIGTVLILDTLEHVEFVLRDTLMANEYFYDHFHQDRSTRVGNWVDRASSKKIFDFIKIEPGQSVLEIGPGRGVFADVCLERHIEYSAVEANRQMAESLRQRGAEVVQAMVPPLPELTKEFDVAVMINALEHMSSVADALKITEQIREVLKPKGRFVICSPDYLNMRHEFFNCDFSHNYVTTRRRLEQLLVDSGFGHIESCHLSGHVSGLLCFLISALVSRLPFGFLSAAFPDSKLIHKLYKGQLTFSRKVLIAGEK